MDETYTEYRSTAFKKVSDERQSLLSLLFLSRKSWPKFTLESLIAIFKACLEDTSGDLFRYLYTLDPPTIQFARFLDWVPAYIKKHHDQSFKLSANAHFKEELAMVLQANSLLVRILSKNPNATTLKRLYDFENSTVPG